MAWRNAISSPGLEYSFNGTACFSNACLISMTSSRRKEEAGREVPFRSFDVSDGSRGGDSG